MVRNTAFYICAFLYDYKEDIYDIEVGKLILKFIEDYKKVRQTKIKNRLNSTIKSLKKSHILLVYNMNRRQFYTRKDIVRYTFGYINNLSKNLKWYWLKRYQHIMKLCYAITYVNRKRKIAE